MAKKISHMMMVQSKCEQQPKFASLLKRAISNGLPKDLHAVYSRIHDIGGDFGIPTKMLVDMQTWEEYFEEIEKEAADIVIRGDNPRAKELGLNPKKEKPMAKKTKNSSEGGLTVDTSKEKLTPKQGDEYRAKCRKVADSLGWELESSKNPIACFDTDGEAIAEVSYGRGWKSNAWEILYNQLSILD